MSSNTVFSTPRYSRSLLSRLTAPIVALALSAAGLAGVAGVVATAVPASATVSAGGFVGVTPNRLLDTRNVGQTPCLTGARNLEVTGGTTTVPEGASAVALNVTVVSPTLPGYVTVYPAGADRPTASNLNYSPGQVVPNGVYVKVGSNQAITLFASGGCPDVIVDVVGYFDGTTPVEPGGFVGVTPNRLVDTRNVGEGPCLSTARNVTVTGGATTVPVGASAVALNVTVVSPMLPGYVTVYPAGAARPTASNVNYSTGQVVPNNVTVKVGDAGAITLFSSGGCPNVIVDVVGYYEGGSPVLDGGFDGLTPNRLLDTREVGQGPCVNGVRNLTVTGGTTTVPEGASAVSLNVTVVSPLTPGYLTVFPAGEARPTASTLNYVAGQVVPNGTVVKVGDNGAISLYTNSGCPHVIVDVVGYYEGSTAATAIAAGGTHTCALLDNQTVQCWGDNTYGQVGDATNTDSNIPVAVSGITTATAITAGGNHSCALLADATVECWGKNTLGQLGDGTNSDSNTPVAVSGITTATAITAGDRHTCALLDNQTVECWGRNFWGQLGDNTGSNSNTPVAVSGITTATAITAGGNHSCALLDNQTVECWGSNSYGQIGDGTDALSSFIPLAVLGITTATAIAAGADHTCALLDNQRVQCWGDNQFGALGDATNTSSNIPVTVLGITTATSVAAGGSETCALLADAAVECWGYNGFGQFGDGTYNDSNIPVPVSDINNATAIAVGGYHACAILANQTTKCWGFNGSGELGDATYNDSNTPVTVSGF